MIKRSYFFAALLFIASSFTVVSCASKPEADKGIPEEEAEAFLSRPRFEKPVARPLHRVLISWEKIDGADGYEVQTSRASDFDPLEKAWTVSGTDHELQFSDDRILYVRVRAFAGNAVSGWSAVLGLREDRL